MFYSLVAYKPKRLQLVKHWNSIIHRYQLSSALQQFDSFNEFVLDSPRKKRQHKRPKYNLTKFQNVAEY